MRAAVLCCFAIACGDNAPICETLAVPSPDLAPRCEGDACVDAYVVAHPDDDLLFMSPALQASLHVRDVVVVYVTAGELGDPGRDQYWRDRERGIVYAYSGGRSDYTAPPALPSGWVTDEMTFAAIDGGDPLVATRYKRDHISLVFLRLGDFQTECLWEQTAGCSSLNPRGAELPYVARTLRGTFVSRDTLRGALAELLHHATSVSALDATGINFDALGSVEPTGYHEYWDHYYSAIFALEPAIHLDIPVRLFRGYTIAREAPNVARGDACSKYEAFAQYAVFDGEIVDQPTPTDYWACPDCYVGGGYQLFSTTSWQRRAYMAESVHATGVLENGVGATTSAAGAMLFDNGQLRTADGLCMATDSAEPCRSLVDAHGHVTGEPVPEQAWFVR